MAKRRTFTTHAIVQIEVTCPDKMTNDEAEQAAVAMLERRVTKLNMGGVVGARIVKMMGSFELLVDDELFDDEFGNNRRVVMHYPKKEMT